MNLKPCPFCRSVNVEVECLEYCRDAEYYVECDECLAKGPTESIESAAIDAWNTRAEYPNCHGSVDGWCTEIGGDLYQEEDIGMENPFKGDKDGTTR